MAQSFCMDRLDEKSLGWLSLLENELGESFSEWSSESREKRGIMAEAARAEINAVRFSRYRFASIVVSNLSYWLIEKVKCQ